MSYFPYSANSALRKNEQFTQLVWDACHTLKQNTPIYNNQHYSAYRLNGNHYDYLIVFTSENMFISIGSKHTSFENELSLLKNNNSKPIYFPLVLADYNNQILTGFEAEMHLSNLGLYRLAREKQKLSPNKDIKVLPGEVNSLNVCLNFWQDFLLTLQQNNLFPEGNIDEALIQIGQDVAEKNTDHQFNEQLIYIHSFAKHYTKNSPFSYCDLGNLYFDEKTNSFVMDEKKYGYVAQYQEDTNEWKLFGFGKNFVYKNASSLLKHIEKKQIDFVRDISLILINDKLTYVSESLVNLECDFLVALHGIENAPTKLKLK